MKILWRGSFCRAYCDTAQKMKFFIKDFFSKCDQIRRKLRIWSHLLKKSLMENFMFVQCDLPETLWKLCFSTKLLQQEIRWNNGILCSVCTIKDLVVEVWSCIHKFFQIHEEFLTVFKFSRVMLTLTCVFLSCHIHAQSQSTICNYLNAKELLVRNRRSFKIRCKTKQFEFVFQIGNL